MVILGLCILLTDWLSYGEGGAVCLKLDVQGQGSGSILDIAEQGVCVCVCGRGGEGGPENWTIFMDVICVSSVISLLLTQT